MMMMMINYCLAPYLFAQTWRTHSRPGHQKHHERYATCMEPTAWVTMTVTVHTIMAMLTVMPWVSMMSILTQRAIVDVDDDGGDDTDDGFDGGYDDDDDNDDDSDDSHDEADVDVEAVDDDDDADYNDDALEDGGSHSKDGKQRRYHPASKLCLTRLLASVPRPSKT